MPEPSVVITVGSKFHAFYLARELEQRGLLSRIVTGFPKLALKPEASWIEPRHLTTLGLPQLALWGLQKFGIAIPDSGYWQAVGFDHWVSQILPPGNIVVSWSGYARETLKRARLKGMRTILKRGSSHIQFQNDLLVEEYARWNYRGPTVDPRMLQREQEEYTLADYITVPCTFARRTFTDKGFSAERVWVTPDGVDTDYFQPAATPRADGAPFRILFAGGVGFRKGVQYLMEAAARLRPTIPLAVTLAGGLADGGRELLARYAGQFQFTDFVSQARLRDLYQQSDVFVMPSIEEGFGVVLAEAMACGLPVIATENTGGPDLIRDGVDGFVIPIRDIEALEDRLATLWRDPERRRAMGQSAREQVRQFSWKRQADIYEALFRAALEKA